jgi:hypothetical protein
MTYSVAPSELVTKDTVLRPIQLAISYKIADRLGVKNESKGSQGK